MEAKNKQLLVFRLPTQTPRSGYVYTDHVTEVAFNAPTLHGLIANVRNHYRVNSLLVPSDLDAVIEDHVCRLNPPSFSVPRPELKPLKPLPPSRGAYSTNQVISRTSLALRGATRMLSMVEIKDSRFPCCTGCCYNVREPCCYTCLIESIFNPKLGAHVPKATKFIGMCSLDRTFTKATSHIENAPEVFAGTAEYPEQCWKRSE